MSDIKKEITPVLPDNIKFHDENNKDFNYEYFPSLWGCALIESYTIGDYSGDIVVVIQHPDGDFGIVAISYGSCALCDVLMEALGKPIDMAKEKIAEVANAYIADIQWFKTMHDLVLYVISDTAKLNHWWANYEELKAKFQEIHSKM